MRGNLWKNLICLLLAFAFIVPETALAARRPLRKAKVSRPDADKAYDLNDIMARPKEFLERQVFFYARFASTANLFKTVSTRFSATEHANFAVWPDKTVLWEQEGRKKVMPTLYIAKNDEESLETLRQLKKYELVAITGYVLNVYARYPWILVTKLEKVELTGDQLCDQVVEHMQAGNEALAKNFGGVAARHFEQALQFGIPCEYQAKAYQQVACAYYLDNQMDKAQDYLRQAVMVDGSDPLLHLALADVCLRMGDADEAVAHCTFALERSGKYPQAYGIMGEAVSLTGDYVKAFGDLNAAANTPGIRPREKAMIDVRRARIYVRAERYADAAQVYAAASEPGEPLGGEAWLHNEIGLFYESLYLLSHDARYLDSAFAAYGEAVKLSRQNDAAILYNQAETEFRRQKLSASPDYTQVRALIDEINKVEPEYTPSRILEGRILFAEGKPEDADARYQSVARLIGDNAVAMMALAEAYLDLGEFEQAALTVDRAKNLEPWNLRVQAIGDFLTEATDQLMTVTQSRPEYMQGYMQGYVQGQGGNGQPPVLQGQPGYQQPQQYQNYQQPQNQQQYQQPYQQEYQQQQEYRQQYETPNAAPAPEYYQYGSQSPDGRNTPTTSNNTYKLDGRLITVRPGEVIRVSADGLARAEAGRDFPQDIQAAAQPAPRPGEAEKPYPVTEVNLDHAAPSRASASSGGLDLGFTPRQQEPGGDDPRETDNGARQSENQDFGMLPGSGEALASVPVWEGGGSGKIAMLPPFSFDPDQSPVIIAAHRAIGEAALDMPVRNANLYRRKNGRQPAEVIEKEPVNPRPLPPDMSVMAPAEDGAVRRAEVRLPSSAIGIGMVSDYLPGE